ncbi:MAG TPA: hypothetical protein PLP29_01195 [Candidatus Ozemobacteraceae bacterium]|nr:hypothetical protein [Candidatus Ozemobacteraceae bacterium]
MKRMIRWRRAFSLLEILVALVFMSFAFLPIYNLFRFGTRGTTSNAREIEATNYASDLINFLRDRRASDLAKVFKDDVGKLKTMNNDAEIMDQLRKMGSGGAGAAIVPPIEEKGYTRSMTVTKYKASSKSLGGMISDFINRRSNVMNYLVSVRVAYAKPGTTTPDEEVVLYTIVMD